MIVDQLTNALRDALAQCRLPSPDLIELTAPKQREHGDFSTNIALQLAKQVGRPPRDVAQQIADALTASALTSGDVALLSGVSVAGPGFLNLTLSTTWLHDVLHTVIEQGVAYGRGSDLAGARINLEFVSANPTGPLHAGGGRWVVVGDVVANLLASQGAVVHREYYLNDAGNQIELFVASLWARYRECLGEKIAFPDDGYRGQYLADIASEVLAEVGADVPRDELGRIGIERIVEGVRSDLARIGVHFDTWFSEQVLHERGDVARILDELRAGGHTFEKDGAEFFRATDFGDSRDRVLVKSDGSTTYLCNDFAYHRDKFARGWEHLIDIWGADHAAQVKSLQVGLEALGHGSTDHGEPEVLIGQWVKLVRTDAVGNKVEVKMSKRAGTYVALADILDEIDPDVTRMTFLLQSMSTNQVFDLDVVAQQSMENPVYYVQYAHARIASIGRKAEAKSVARRPIDTVDLALLVDECELDVLRALHSFPELLADAARSRAPHRVTTWVRDLAGKFQRFYHECRVLTDDVELTQARLWLVEACRIGLANALAILGVSAPDEMSRLDDDDDDDAVDLAPV